MAGVKTAISVEKSLFEEVNKVAKEMHISRSRLFVIAVSDFLKKCENQKLLAKINDAYDDFPDAEENEILQKMRKKQRKNLNCEK